MIDSLFDGEGWPAYIPVMTPTYAGKQSKIRSFGMIAWLLCGKFVRSAFEISDG